MIRLHVELCCSLQAVRVCVRACTGATDDASADVGDLSTLNVLFCPDRSHSLYIGSIHCGGPESEAGR